MLLGLSFELVTTWSAGSMDVEVNAT
jgi:hypothetical protein